MCRDIRVLRANKANELIAEISDCGRRFFEHNTRVSRFDVDKRGRVWFTDAYTTQRIYTHHHGRWRGFSNGSTLRALIERLRDFIVTGEPQFLNLGPWHPDLCGGDLWGYGYDDMQIVRDKARELGLVKTSKPTTPTLAMKEPQS